MMQVITDANTYRVLWDKVYDEYGFHLSEEAWLSLPQPYKKYRLSALWTEEQEKLVNGIFMRLCPEMYALDWQHDCFTFSPSEEIPPDTWYYDAERDCNVYFPCYYPNGDYHFFLSADWYYGLFGHPWREEIYVMGDALIQAFEAAKDQLNLSDAE